MSRLESYFKNSFLALNKLFVLENDIPSADIDHSTIKNILVVIRHQMGDMMCALPMIESLRIRYEDADITLVTKDSSRFEEIFKHGDPPVDRVKNYEYGLENLLNIISELRRKPPDLAIVPSPAAFSATNHLIAYYSRAKIRVGVMSRDSGDNRASYLLNVKDDFRWEKKKTHQIERNLDMLRLIGIEPEVKRIRLELADENRNFAESFFRENFPDKGRPVTGFHPGAAKPGNVWAPGKFAELAYSLHKDFNSYLFISQGPEDARYVGQMEDGLRNFGVEDYVRFHGPLMNDAGLISKLSLFVTNDTGIMHLAAGFDTPVIALFGPTNAWQWGPVGGKKMSIQSESYDINDIPVKNILELCGDFLQSDKQGK